MLTCHHPNIKEMVEQCSAMTGVSGREGKPNISHSCSLNCLCVWVSIVWAQGPQTSFRLWSLYLRVLFWKFNSWRQSRRWKVNCLMTGISSKPPSIFHHFISQGSQGSWSPSQLGGARTRDISSSLQGLYIETTTQNKCRICWCLLWYLHEPVCVKSFFIKTWLMFKG